MRKNRSIQTFMRAAILRYAIAGFSLLAIVALAISFILAREQMATDLEESAIAVAQAFHDRILEGDIKSVEAQLKKLLKIREGESAQILRHDLSRVYSSYAPMGKVQSCPIIGATCFDGYFGQARVFVPISLAREGGNADRFLYISKRIHLNWGYLFTVFAVFALGYLGLLIAFLRVSKVASTRLGSEILSWSNRLKANPKDIAPIAPPPFTELLPLRHSLEGLHAQIEKFEKTATDKARLLLLRGIAHDLLTPVARLQLYIGTLGYGIDKTTHADTLEEIHDSLESVKAVASQVKTLNELDAPVEQTELIAAAQQEIRSLRDSKALSSKSIQLEFQSTLANHLSPFSRTEISRILSNLVQNAADASADGSVVSVEVGQANGSAFLSIRDNGCGIPAAVQSRVFDPDFTLKPGTGTGLGLAIVKYICDRRSAEIELTSQVNAGTTITIRLPESGAAYV